MTTKSKLTKNQTLLLQDAQDKVTKEVFDNINSGEEIKINEMFCLYRYVSDDVISIVLTDDWEETLQVIKKGENFIFEVL